MEKEFSEAYYNYNDNHFYLREYDDETSLYAKQIMVYDNKIKIMNFTQQINFDDVDKCYLSLTDSLTTGDIIHINNSSYVCLYYDKTRTILYKRDSMQSLDNITQIPSNEEYLKTGKVSLEELLKIYSEFQAFKGLLKGFCLDAIDSSVKRLLKE